MARHEWNPDFQAWFDEVDRRTVALTSILSLPGVVALVNDRTRRSLGHVPDIPLKCGTHETGYFVRLGVSEGTVVVDYASTPDLAGTTPAGIAHINELVSPLHLVCPVCGRISDRSPVDVVKSALKALTTRRPAVQART